MYVLYKKEEDLVIVNGVLMVKYKLKSSQAQEYWRGVYYLFEVLKQHTDGSSSSSAYLKRPFNC